MATYRSSRPSSRSSGTSCSLDVESTRRRKSLSSETIRSAAGGFVAMRAMALFRALNRKCGLSCNLRVSSSDCTSRVTTRCRSADSLLASRTRCSTHDVAYVETVPNTPSRISFATSSSGVMRASWTTSIGLITRGTRFVDQSHVRRPRYSANARTEMKAAFRTEEATGRPASTTKYMRKIGDLSASTPDCATAYPPMMAVTAVTSTLGFTDDSHAGSSDWRYHMRYCATVQRSTGHSTSTLAVLSARERCGAYMSAAAVSRNTTAARRPLSIRSARSRLRRRLSGGANEEMANNCIK